MGVRCPGGPQGSLRPGDDKYPDDASTVTDTRFGASLKDLRTAIPPG